MIYLACLGIVLGVAVAVTGLLMTVVAVQGRTALGVALGCVGFWCWVLWSLWWLWGR